MYGKLPGAFKPVKCGSWLWGMPYQTLLPAVGVRCGVRNDRLADTAGIWTVPGASDPAPAVAERDGDTSAGRAFLLAQADTS